MLTPSNQNTNAIYTGPGLYKIQCNLNNKAYYGESDNIALRAGSHINDLNNNRHITPGLQEDWNNYGASAFTCYVLATGPIYKSKNERLKLERLYIKKDPPLTYNVQITKTGYLQTQGILFPVTINNIKFPSIPWIHKAFPLPRNKIVERLLNSNTQAGEILNLTWPEQLNPNFVINELLNQATKVGKRAKRSKPYAGKVIYNGVIYESAKVAADITKMNVNSIYWAINDIKRQDSAYLNPDGSKVQKEKYAELKSKKQYSFNIEGVHYPRLGAVIKKYKISQFLIYKRCRSNEPCWSSWSMELPKDQT
jgi:hypothetical protein